MDTIMKNQFGVDEIHAVRMQIAEERKNMSPEEARMELKKSADIVWRQIEDIRQGKQIKEAAV